ncbi:hypothetical protein ACFX14_040304 [Malus domestica]
MSWKTLKHPGSRRIKKAFFVHRSTKIKPDGPWINNHPPLSPSLNGPLKKAFIVHQLFILKDQAPTAPLDRQHQQICSSAVHQAQAPTTLEESVHHSSLFFEIKPKSPRRSVQTQKLSEIRSSLFFEIKPKSPRRSVQTQKLSKIRSSLFFEFKPKSPRKSVHHCSSRSSPKALEDPSITILQDQAQKPLKICSSSFIQDQASTALGSIAHPINQHLTEIESEDQNRERLNFPCSQIGTPSGTISASHLFLRSRNSSALQKINGIKEGSNCSRNRRKEQKRPRRNWCHFGHHDSKHGKGYFCRLFHLCINSAKGTKAPKTRAFDHLSLTKGTKGGKPKEIL